MRKIGLLLLIAALGFGLVGCAASGNEGSSAEPSVQVATSTASADPTNSAAQSLEPSPSSTSLPSSSETSSPNKTDEKQPTPSPSPSPSSSPSASPSSPTPSKEPDKATPVADNVTLSIEGNAEWGTIMAAESFDISQGDTPASVLKRAAKKHRLSYGIKGSGAMTYVEGIDGLFEFDDGPTSGWKFKVNGVVSDIGAGAYKLKAGDRVEWYYVSEDDAAQEEKESAS